MRRRIAGEREAGEPRELFAGGGRMGGVMQSIDWSKTAAGPVEDWPEGLKTALRMLLKQPSPGLILWGPKRVQFHNDAWESLAGDADGSGIGEPSDPQIWTPLESALARVYDGETAQIENALHVVERNGELRECYFNQFCGPVNGEAGKTAGVFCILQETTAQVLAERRLRTLRDLAAGVDDETEEDACAATASILSRNPADFPFACLYLYSGDRKLAKLAGVAGVREGSEVSPQTLLLEGEGSIIGAAASAPGGALVRDLPGPVCELADGRLAKVECAQVVPVLRPGEHQACGFLLAGLSPLQRPNDKYLDFLKLVAAQAALRIAAADAARATQSCSTALSIGPQLDHIAQLAWMANPDGDIFWYNRRWYEYTGATPDDMAGWGWQSVHHPDLLPAVLEKWRESLRTGCPFRMEFPLRGADGSFRWFLTLVEPVRDEAGRIVRWFGTNTDITEFKRVRDERAVRLEDEREARASAELLNQIGPTLLREREPNKLVQAVTDLATTLTAAEFGAFFHNVVNEKGESYMLYTLSGVPREAFAGFPMPRNTAIFAPTFGGEGVVRSDDITQDERYGKSEPYRGMPEGHLPVRSYLAVPVISRSGDVLGGLFFGHSAQGRFTAQHEAMVSGIAAQAAIALDNARLFEQAQWVQDELKRSNEELRRANNDLETFAYSASHDLQEPLRNVAICAQLLQRSAGRSFDQESVKFLDGILQGARRMETLVKDLLQYAGATRYAQVPADQVDSRAVLKSVLTDLQGQIAESGATITSGELPVVSMHEVHLKQLFQNLIANALKYRKEEAPIVEISASRRQGWWIFSVADNGIGIDPKFSDQIFGLFKRLHNRSQYAGSGIGLAICQRVVEQYGGRIWLAQSTPGRGSVFSFSIPES